MNSDDPVTLSYSTTGTMFGRLVFLGLLLFCVAADGRREDFPRQPECPTTGADIMCPMNYDPVCGSDGHIYPNECSMCASLQSNKMGLFITDMTHCSSQGWV